MNKKIRNMSMLLVLVISFVLNIKVNAVTQITSYVGSIKMEGSNECKAHYCATDLPDAGLRITLIKSNNVTVGKTKNFWPTQNMVNFMNNKNVSYLNKNKYSNCEVHNVISIGANYENVYVSSAGLLSSVESDNASTQYSSYINNLNKTKIDAILKELTGSSNVSTYYTGDYYLKFEPIYVMKEMINEGSEEPSLVSNVCNYYAGNTYDILGSFGVRKCYTKYSCSNYKDSKTYGLGYWYVNGKDPNITWDAPLTGYWNATRNFILSMYVSKSSVTSAGLNVKSWSGTSSALASYQSSTTTSNLYTLNNYYKSGNGLGVGYVKIKEYAPPITVNVCKKKLDGSKLVSANLKFKVTSADGYNKELNYDNVNKDTGCWSLTLTSGIEYTITETERPSDDFQTISAQTITPTTDGQTITITNKSNCEVDFEGAIKDGVATMAERVTIYQKYADKDYNNLLNMNIISASKACSRTSKDTCSSKTTNSFSCLNGKITGTYSNANSKVDLSCYNDILYKSDGKTPAGYCVTSFNLANQLGKTNFNGLSGQLITPNQQTAMTGNLSSFCYIFDTSGKYKSKFISDVELEYKNENAIANSSAGYTYVGATKYDAAGIVSQGYTAIANNTGYYNFSKQINYSFYPVFSAIGTGKIFNSKTNCINCIQLGYGIVSRLNDKADKGELPFSITFRYFDHSSQTTKNEETRETETLSTKNLTDVEKKCTYETEKKIVTCDPSDPECDEDPDEPGKEMLNLEFRIIDTANPFPGKSGNGRKVGSNWCDPEHNYCFVDDNPIIKSAIIDRNDSYNSKKTGAKYKITLTRKNIETIRNYNKKHSYDDFETMKCDDEGNCTSTFLKDMGITKK